MSVGRGATATSSAVGGGASSGVAVTPRTRIESGGVCAGLVCLVWWQWSGFCLAVGPVGAGVPGDPDVLNGPLPAGGSIIDFEVSPDGARVVYVADQNAGGVFELFSVPIGGGTPTRLNGPLVAGGDVQFGFVVSPDSSRVVYQADEDVDDDFELFRCRWLVGSRRS